MRTVNEIRLHNLELLLKECGGEEWGSAAKLSALTGVASPLISQIRNRVPNGKSGKPREIGDVTARKLEKGMQKDPGWLDSDHQGAESMEEADWLDLLRRMTPEERKALQQTAQVIVKGK